MVCWGEEGEWETKLNTRRGVVGAEGCGGWGA